MANPEKKKSDNFFKRFIRFFARLGLRIGRSFRDMIAELKKVTWPTRKELANYTVVVIAFIVLMGVVIMGIDTASAFLIRLVSNT